MQRRLPHQLDLAKELLQHSMDDEVPELAAGLAYRFLFAVFPFAIFLAALASFVSSWVGLGDPTATILGAVGDNLPPDVAQQLAPQLEAVLGQSRPALLSIGALLALWAATGGITSLMAAMNKAYDVTETRGFLPKTARAVALTVLGSAGILVAFVTVVGGSILTEQAVATLGIGPGAWSTISLLRFPVMLGLVALAVAALFRFGPNVAVGFRWALVGGAVFAVGWLVATVVFGLYVANFGSYANTYGALGGVIVLMLWFYLTAVLLLVAAELTALLAKAHEPAKVAARRAETAAASGEVVEAPEPAAPKPAAPEPAAAEPVAPVSRVPRQASRPAQGSVPRPSRLVALALVVGSWLVGAMLGLGVRDGEESLER